VGEVDRAKELLAQARAVLALTGAGISTDSGIPDFRGPNGVWTRNPDAERLATLSHYLADAEVRRRAWRSRLESPAWQARPNPGHLALVDLERQGRLLGIVTQNTDGLHTSAGSDPAKVVEIHGNQHWTVCWSCGDRRPMSEILARVAVGETDPDCAAESDGRRCAGILKSATISFGQALVAADLERATDLAANCDLLLALGTTLSVYPAAGLVPHAKAHGARILIINQQPTELDDLADVVLAGSISELLPKLV
jgi:NAD-dependent deacetylase